MGYLILQICICLIIAFLLGLILGWFLTRGSRDRSRHSHDNHEYTIQLKKLESERDIYREKYSDLELKFADLEKSQPSADVAANIIMPGSDDSYPVEEVEGIGPAYGSRLRELQIENTMELLEKCCESSQQEAISKHVKVEPFVVAKWVSMSDLMRINGVRGQFAELLEASGISSISELAAHSSTDLVEKMIQVNAEEHRTPTVPGAEEVNNWISQAKNLPQKIKSLVEK